MAGRQYCISEGYVSGYVNETTSYEYAIPFGYMNETVAAAVASFIYDFGRLSFAHMMVR